VTIAARVNSRKQRDARRIETGDRRRNMIEAQKKKRRVGRADPAKEKLALVRRPFSVKPRFR